MTPRKRDIIYQLPLILGLIALWMLLWGEFSVVSFIGGVLVAIVVGVVFYLPRVQLAGRFNLWYSFTALVVFFYHVFIASISVALQSLWLGHYPKNAIVKIPLRSRDDMVMTLTAEAISLVPGTVVVEQDRVNGVLYLHALNVKDLAGVEKVRQNSWDQERRLILALGPHSDVQLIRQEDRERATARRERKGLR